MLTTLTITKRDCFKIEQFSIIKTKYKKEMALSVVGEFTNYYLAVYRELTADKRRTILTFALATIFK